MQDSLPLSLAPLVLLAAIASGCTSQSQPMAKTPEAHSEHATGSTAVKQAGTLILSTKPPQPRVGEPVQLQMMLHDASGQMLNEFEPTHTKLAHLIIVRKELDEFAHLHPTVDVTGNMTATRTFSSGGTYLVFLDHKPAGRQLATSQAKLVIEGDAPPAPALTPNVPGTIEGDGLRARVSMRVLPGEAHVISFEVQDGTGTATRDLQPYLGAMGHLVVISADGAQYVHAHPLTESAPDGKVEFEVHFPGPGTYKGWGQFQRGDRVFTIPAVVKIQAAAHH